jgi:hypothetical protein
MLVPVVTRRYKCRSCSCLTFLPLSFLLHHPHYHVLISLLFIPDLFACWMPTTSSSYPLFRRNCSNMRLRRLWLGGPFSLSLYRRPGCMSSVGMRSMRSLFLGPGTIGTASLAGPVFSWKPPATFPLQSYRPACMWLYVACASVGCQVAIVGCHSLGRGTESHFLWLTTCHLIGIVSDALFLKFRRWTKQIRRCRHIFLLLSVIEDFSLLVHFSSRLLPVR